MSRSPLDEVAAAAVADLARSGYDSADRVAYWSARLKEAAEATLGSQARAEEAARDALYSVYRKLVDQGRVLRLHPGVERFRVEQLTPQMRAELDRRILANLQLIRLRRQAAVQETARRFAGWATSLPVGEAEVDRRAEKASLTAPLRKLPFEQRRLMIDQGHKLSAAVSAVVGQAALAVVWHSRWRQPGYNYRRDHKERDERVYLIRGSWAQERGLVRPGEAGYYDEVTAVAQEPFCRCYATYLHGLRQLPAEMLTAKGRAELERVSRGMVGA